MEDIAGPLKPLRGAAADIAYPLYRHIDWSRCAVAGSYALQQYERTTWDYPPQDIDIPCKVASTAEFEGLVAQFIERTNSLIREAGAPKARIEKYTIITPEMRLARLKELGGEERFHESIIATSTLHVPEVPLPVQLIAIDATSHIYGEVSLLEHLALICDLPASVSYTAKAYKKIFHVPERALDPIECKRIPADKICASRRAKYEQRGYSFYE